MDIMFNCRLTKKGNFKVPSEVLKLLDLNVGDSVVVSCEKASDVYSREEMDKSCSECLNIPANVLVEAGISAENGLNIYIDDGRIIIEESEDDEVE